MPEPTAIETYRDVVAHRLQSRLGDRSMAETMQYIQQVNVLRETARMAGIEEWTDAHTDGALFACSALTSALAITRLMDLISATVETKIRLLVEEQELISVLLEYRT